MINKYTICFILLLGNIFYFSDVLASENCDIDKCRNDCNEIGLPLRSCKAPICIPVCGPLDEPSEVFPVAVPVESGEG